MLLPDASHARPVQADGAGGIPPAVMAHAPVTRRSMARSSLGIMPRDLPEPVALALADVPFRSLPSVRVRGPADGLRQEMAARLRASGLGHGWLTDWLVEDAAFLAFMFASVSGAREVSLRLEGIDGDACRIFHVDKVRLRLVTTYVGPGTEYLDPGVPADALPRAVAMPTGHVAVFRGAKALPDGVQGLVHRSPPLAGTGRHRLFLSVDEGI